MAEQTVRYKELFSKTLYEELERVFTERGIKVITEDELDSIVDECYRKTYYQSIAEFRQATGQQNYLSKTAWTPRPSAIARHSERILPVQ